MMGWLIALLAGTITGILSAFGIGGGSLLLIYLTSFAAIDPFGFIYSIIVVLIYHLVKKSYTLNPNNQKDYRKIHR